MPTLPRITPIASQGPSQGMGNPPGAMVKAAYGLGRPVQGTKLVNTGRRIQQVVRSHGPQFTSGHLELFLASLGIQHTFTAPFHPASNALAECMVHTAKEALGRMEGEDWQTKIAQYLLIQHTTPCLDNN